MSKKKANNKKKEKVNKSRISFPSSILFRDDIVDATCLGGGFSRKNLYRHRMYPSHWNTDLYQWPRALYKQDLSYTVLSIDDVLHHQTFLFFSLSK